MNEIIMERDLVALPEPKNALATFTTEGAIEPILADVRKKVDAFLAQGHGVDTAAGRDAIRSFAHKVTKSKTALEEVGAELAKDAKKIPGLIDATRRDIKTKLDKWRDEVRQPLTDWETAEEDRVNSIKERLAGIQREIDDREERTVQYLKDTLVEIEHIDCYDEAAFGEYSSAAIELKERACYSLAGRIAAAEKREAEAAELARLRIEKEARDKKDREEQIARDAAAKAKAVAEQTAQAERDAAAKREADLKAAAEKAERDKQEAEDRAAKAEEAARAKVLADARARAEAEEREQRAREADQQHRATVNRAALDVLVANGIAEDVGKAVLKLIINGAVPAVVIHY